MPFAEFVALDDAVERHAEGAFALLEDLVAADSTVGREQAALEVLAGELHRLGLQVDRLPFPSGPLEDPRAGVSQAVPGGPRYQVLGTTPGTGPLHVLLNGHMDVVPADSPALWTTAPFTPDRRDGRMYGRGTGDMKGGFALGCLALRALGEVAPNLFVRRRLGFLAVIEEECTGNGALWSAAHQDALAEAVVLLEPTGLDLLVGGVGVLWVDLEVRGRSTHAESAHLAANPVDLGMVVVEGLRAWCAGLVEQVPDPGLSAVTSPYNVNLGGVSAGDWHSSVPVTATFRLRIGFPRAWTAERAEQEVRATVGRLVDADPRFPGLPTVTASGLRARGYVLEESHELVTAMSDAHEQAHGTRPLAYSLGSTTDARTYLNDFGVPALCFGALAHDIHGVDESVDLASIVAGARTLARFLLTRFGSGA